MGFPQWTRVLELPTWAADFLILLPWKSNQHTGARHDIRKSAQRGAGVGVVVVAVKAVAIAAATAVVIKVADTIVLAFALSL